MDFVSDGGCDLRPPKREVRLIYQNNKQNANATYATLKIRGVIGHRSSGRRDRWAGARSEKKQAGCRTSSSTHKIASTVALLSH
eukprot:scaffold6602_cov34-Attheya_sp.AAC.2